MLEDGQDGMDSGSLTPGSARQVCIQRHPSHGFGFIAGSERPVVVRSVSAGKTRVSVWSYGMDVCRPLSLVCQPVNVIFWVLQIWEDKFRYLRCTIKFLFDALIR